MTGWASSLLAPVELIGYPLYIYSTSVCGLRRPPPPYKPPAGGKPDPASSPRRLRLRTELAMNALLRPEPLPMRAAAPEAGPLATAAVIQRTVWDSRYGPIVIEVRNGQVFVNGSWVEPAAPSGPT